MEDLVYFPEEDDEKEEDRVYKNSGKGMSIFLVLLESNYKRRQRQKCHAGSIIWPVQSIVIAPESYTKLNNKLVSLWRRWRFRKLYPSRLVDMAMLIGSTTKSFWNEKTELYWRATERDLTVKGKELLGILSRVYKQKPDIVTLLDT